MNATLKPFSRLTGLLAPLMPNKLEAVRVKPDGSLEVVFCTNCSKQDNRKAPTGEILLQSGGSLHTRDSRLYFKYRPEAAETGLLWRVDGILYYPSHDPVDLAGQTELLQIPLSRPRAVLHDTLSFTVPGALIQNLTSLNWVNSEPSSLLVNARIKATSDPNLRVLTGADQTEMVITGLWGTHDVPTPKPTQIDYRSSTALTLSGVLGKLEIRMGLPLDLEHKNITKVFGEAFLGVWRAH